MTWLTDVEDRGYIHRICPRCHKHFWTDCDEPCPHGCYDYDLYRKAKKRDQVKYGNADRLREGV